MVNQPKDIFVRVIVPFIVAIPRPITRDPAPITKTVVEKLWNMTEPPAIIQTKPPASSETPARKNENITKDIETISVRAINPNVIASGIAMGEAKKASITSHADCQFFFADVLEFTLFTAELVIICAATEVGEPNSATTACSFSAPASLKYSS